MGEATDIDTIDVSGAPNIDATNVSEAADGNWSEYIGVDEVGLKKSCLSCSVYVLP